MLCGKFFMTATEITLLGQIVAATSAKWMIRHFGHRQANRAAWNVVKEAFEQPFQDFVDEQIRLADRALSKRDA